MYDKTISIFFRILNGMSSRITFLTSESEKCFRSCFKFTHSETNGKENSWYVWCDSTIRTNSNLNFMATLLGRGLNCQVYNQRTTFSQFEQWLSQLSEILTWISKCDGICFKVHWQIVFKHCLLQQDIKIKKIKKTKHCHIHKFWTTIRGRVS